MIDFFDSSLYKILWAKDNEVDIYEDMRECISRHHKENEIQVRRFPINGASLPLKKVH